jgi:hypothetical protein
VIPSPTHRQPRWRRRSAGLASIGINRGECHAVS